MSDALSEGSTEGARKMGSINFSSLFSTCELLGHHTQKKTKINRLKISFALSHTLTLPLLRVYFRLHRRWNTRAVRFVTVLDCLQASTSSRPLGYLHVREYRLFMATALPPEMFHQSKQLNLVKQAPSWRLHSSAFISKVASVIHKTECMPHTHKHTHHNETGHLRRRPIRWRAQIHQHQHHKI